MSLRENGRVKRPLPLCFLGATSSRKDAIFAAAHLWPITSINERLCANCALTAAISRMAISGRALTAVINARWLILQALTSEAATAEYS